MENIYYQETQADRISNLMNMSNYHENPSTQIPWEKIIVVTTVGVVIGMIIYEYCNREDLTTS